MDLKPSSSMTPPAPPGETPFRLNFESFYAREVKQVIGLAFVLSGSRSGAEDLAQEAFLAAYRHWDRISRFDNPGSWVRRVVANRSVSMIRRRTAEARALVRLDRSEHLVPEMGVESDLLWGEVRRLPTRQRQVIALRYLDRQPIAEIASILECSENTVKTHLSRAKQELARRLKPEQE